MLRIFGAALTLLSISSDLLSAIQATAAPTLEPAPDCKVLLENVENTRRATERMLAEVDEQRKRSVELGGSLAPEARRQLDEVLNGQERSLRATLDGLSSVTCKTPSIGAGTERK